MENLLKFPETRAFLADYPKSRWQDCMESAFVYGLYCLKRDFPSGLSIPELLKISGKDCDIKSARVVDIGSVKGKSPILARTLPNLELKFSSSSSTVKNSACQTLNIKPVLLHSSSIFSNSPLKEPKTCSLTSAKNLLKHHSTPEIFQNSPSFQTRLQKKGLRHKNFPVIELDLPDPEANASSFESDINSITTSTLL